ncbi:MAG: type II toxin-antitoxin system RelE/ParE family toxin [Candidatus Bathyarchaeia archaeon]
MPFSVLLHPKAAKALQKLDPTDKARVKKALGKLAGDPWKAGKQLNPSTYWGLREGDYRAIYEIDKEKNQVVVIFIGHRKNVYDDFAKML